MVYNRLILYLVQNCEELLGRAKDFPYFGGDFPYNVIIRPFCRFFYII